MSETSENYVHIAPSECKGCSVCVEACPNDCIIIGENINELGYQFAKFERHDCTACGMCYWVCPEPGAVTVYKKDKEQN